ncbi:MAG: beta-propeller fold lactonase family protein [Planctomycetes bacterium]|nr:beta-propeller fold lactonase family protein [Planctomycetota bacterium]
MSASRLWVRNGIPVIAILIAGSCDNSILGCFGGVKSSSPPPRTVSYDTPSLRLWATAAMTPNTATVQNCTPDSFGSVPGLPAGLDIDPATGTITGVPVIPQPMLFYTIEARTAGVLSASTTLRIEVLDGLAPAGLVYQPALASVPRGSALPQLVPGLSGVPETFTVSPALPGGISLDPANGIISGTCDGDLGITQHTVTATNPLGSSAAQVQIEILPAPGLRGYLVPSGGDGTLDVFDDRNLGFGPIDAAYCNGAAPVATVGTADGRFVFAACSDSNLYRADRDTTSGRLGPLTQVAGAFGVRHLLATSDGQHLVVVGDASVTRYDLAGDGSICCPSQIPGPFAPSAALLATNQVLVLATSAPGTLTVYDLVPILQQRAGSVLVGADVAIAALLDRDGGRRLYAATSTYDFNTHALTGALRNFTLSTPAEISGGAAAAVQTQSITRGGELTSLHYRELSLGNVREVFVADGSQGRVYVFSSAADGTLSTANVATHVIGGRPIALGLGTRTSDIAVLDETQEQLSTYRAGSGDFELMSRTRTRRLPRALVPLFGDDSTAVADQFFVTSAADSTLLAVRIDPVVPGELLASAQGPVASGSTPLDVATSYEAPLVFTADLGGPGISAFRCDPATQLLTPTDTEALSPGSQPIALAVTTSGDHLHAVDRTGRIVAFSVDSSTGTVDTVGSLALSGSLVDAVVRSDVLGRFVFIVQPEEGRVTTASIHLPGGFLLSSSTLNSLPRPADIWLPLDGRFAYVLDQQLARVVAYSIDPVDGALVALGSSFDLSGSPTRLTCSRPVERFFLSPTSAVFALDPQSERAFAINRSWPSGLLSASQTPTATLSSNPGAVISCSQPSLLEHGLLSTSDDGVAGLLSARIPTPPSSAWGVVGSVALGRGPHAIASRISWR